MSAVDQPPPLRAFLSEGLDLPAVMLAPLLPAVPSPARGRGRAVLVLPGFLASDATTARLRRSLAAADFRAFGWEEGINLGVSEALLARLAARIADIAGDSGGRIVLLGWSLGGLYARELAKRVPHHVELVMTLGSPFSGSVRANNAWRLYELVNGHPIDALPVEVELSASPPVRTIAVWSAQDGIVSPASSRGVPGEADETVEISARHMGMATTAEGIRAVIGLLAQQLG